MDYKKTIGFGAAIWVLMFVIVSVFIAFKIYSFALGQVIIAVIAGAIAYVFAGYAKPETAGAALSYGASWVITGLILDAVVTAKFNSAIFYSWSLWLGYLLVLTAPLLKVKKTA